MKKNIIIFYEHINREYFSCLELKNELEKNESANVYLLSIVFEYFKAIKLSKKIKIDMVIMPWLYHNNDYEYVQPFIKSNKHVYIVNLHHEQVGSEVSYRMLLPRGSAAKNSTIHFVWGENFKKKITEKGVKEELVFITGNIRSDNLYKTQKDRNKLSHEFALDLKKKWILFAENRGWVLSYNKSKSKYLIYRGYTNQEIEERLEVNQKSLNFTINEFDELGEDFFSKFELIYRPHPGTKSPKINNKIKVIDKYSIYEWINAIDINVVWASTTIFESDILNVPSFVYEPIKNLGKFKTDGVEEYPKITTLRELLDDEFVYRSKQYLNKKKIFENYLGKVDGHRTEEMSIIIHKILESGVENYKPFERKCSKYRLFKKYLFEVVTRVFVKLEILEKLKYPKTAYNLIKDIPYYINKK